MPSLRLGGLRLGRAAVTRLDFMQPAGASGRDTRAVAAAFRHPFTFLMKIARTLPAAGMLVLVLLAGCRGAPPASMDGPSPAARDSVLALLRATGQDTLRAAFAHLADAPYTRYVRTEQRDAAARLTAYEERTVRYEAEASSLLAADTAGTFDFGYLGSFVGSPTDDRTAADLPQQIIPEDPPYLAPRNYEAYAYRLLPDTLLFGRPTRVIEVQAAPGADLNVRYVRLYRDRPTGELVALSLERRERKLFFREESRLFIQIRPAADGGWLPFLTRITTHLRVSPGAPQTLRTVSAYYAMP